MRRCIGRSLGNGFGAYAAREAWRIGVLREVGAGEKFKEEVFFGLVMTGVEEGDVTGSGCGGEEFFSSKDGFSAFCDAGATVEEVYGAEDGFNFGFNQGIVSTAENDVFNVFIGSEVRF